VSGVAGNDEASAPTGGATAGAGGADAGPPGPASILRGFSPLQRLLITLAATVIILLFMRTAAGFIVPILLALVVTMAVSPFLSWLMRHGLPAWLAWLITVILTTAVVVFVFVLAGVGVARLIGEVQAGASRLQGHLDSLTARLDEAGLHLSGLTTGNGTLNGQHIVHVALKLLGTARQVLGGVALTLLIAFFMLGEATTVQLRFSMTPPNVSPTLRRLESFTRDMRSFIQATTIIGFFNGAAIGVYLWLLGVHYPAMWGVFAFFMTFIPTLGVFIAMVPPTLLALIDSGWKDALLVVLGFLVVYAVTATLRSGRFVGRRLNLSPLVILLSIILWGWVLGLMGGLLAVPMTLLVRRLLLEAYDESRWVTDLLGRPTRALADGPPPGPQQAPRP